VSALRHDLDPCDWVGWCEAPAAHRVERQTRPGLILRETVCDDHVHTARERGYLLRGPVEGAATRPSDRVVPSRPGAPG
jgi:hypothetical protein